MTVPSAADAFFDSLAAGLLAQAGALAARWMERSAAAAPRPADQAQEEGSVVVAESVVRALIGSLGKDARWPGEVMRLGWEAGALAHRAGLAPHHVLTDAELLVAVLLAAAEQHVRNACDAPADAADPADPLRTAGAADGIAAARQLQRAGALYTHAAAASFLHAIVSALRAHYRVLRHDLRNPVGTIRGALSLMEDETVPIESRLGPQVRAMVARNALSLDDLITTGLDDLSAESLLHAPQQVSLHALAVATRRGLREPSRLAECEIVIGESLPAVRVDPSAVELTLSAVLLAGIACSAPGDVLRVDDGVGHHPADVVTIRIVHERGDDRVAERLWDPHGLELAASVAAEFDGCIGAAPSEDPGYVPERRRTRRIRRRSDPEPLVGLETLYVELPILPPAAEGHAPSAPHARASRATPAQAAAAAAAPPAPPANGRDRAAAVASMGASAAHQGDDLARPD